MIISQPCPFSEKHRQRSFADFRKDINSYRGMNKKTTSQSEVEQLCCSWITFIPQAGSRNCLMFLFNLFPPEPLKQNMDFSETQEQEENHFVQDEDEIGKALFSPVYAA